MGNTNQNRGPWCRICGVEMNHPNHRSQACMDDTGSLIVRRFHGELLPGFEPLCGEGCLAKYVAQWAQNGAPAEHPPTTDNLLKELSRVFPGFAL